MKSQKRLLMLGGSHFQIPSILSAKEAGHYVITCDYLPENPGHKYADEYYNVSTTDYEGVLKLAKNLDIDGIVAYASDPAAPTAAYVAEKLSLPGNPYDSVVTLAYKDKFRSFLKANNFNVPESKGFDDIHNARAFFLQIKKPVMIKPVDSSGSKGVRKIYDISEFDDAFNYALEFSRAKRVVVEEFVLRKGYQVAGDGFVVNGKLVFTCFANEHFDEYCNPLVPIGESFPAIHDKKLLNLARMEIQRVLSLLGWRDGALNFDFMFDEDDRLYLLEIGPRNGGNLIPDVIRIATGVDIIRYTINAALGLDCSELHMKDPDGYYSSYILHSNRSGILDHIDSSAIQSDILFYQEFISSNQQVDRFDGSNHTIGALILKHSSLEEMLERMSNMGKYINVIIKDDA